MPSTLRTWLAGPPFALPAPLDRLAEAWWRATPRARTAVAVAGATTLVTLGVGQAASSPYGPPTTVQVAVRDLAVGELAAPGDLRRTSWPRDLVPEDAVDAPGGTLRAPLPRGAVLTGAHLGGGGPAADLPAGRVAVPIAHDALPVLDPGTRLDLVGLHPDGSVTTLTTDAVVIHVDATDAWLSIDDADAVAVSAAGAAGAIAAVVRPP
jgi:pilus assembly protein CpaB